MRRDSASESRLLVVSNRLPFTIQAEDGQYRFAESTGGLVTGLRSYLDGLAGAQAGPRRFLWVGWPGGTAPEEVRQELRDRALQIAQALPVFLSEAEMDLFYHGFCNKTIWPLFHYFPSYASYDNASWESYVRVNQAFCDALIETTAPGDLIWIHDYHLMLLPRMLRERLPGIPIGFFLHIPFPSFEVLRLLPVAWRRQLLEGLLGADLVGFHTYEYTQHFLQSVLRILGFDHDMGQVVSPDHVARVGTYPMGIDYSRFADAAALSSVDEERVRVRESLGARRVVLSIDRLDYSKGILGRLDAFELFLSQHPDARQRVVLVLVVVPSRVAVSEYHRMKQQIEETVGRINGRFGALDWTPILYQYRQLPFEPLSALYAEADVALVTPLRDGMNLVAKEYIAARGDRGGVLILSEMAGAAKELGEAIVVNPNDCSQIAGAIHEALEMPREEQVRRNQIMQERIRRYNIARWAQDFTADLTGMREVQSRLYAKVLPRKARADIIDRFASASRPLLFLDYDGTLVPLARRPQDAAPTRHTLDMLERLCSDSRAQVVIVSGRDRHALESWLGMLPADLIAEHGALVRVRGGVWTRTGEFDTSWKNTLQPILQLYADRLPGAFVEEKSHSLVWHYRAADPEQARMLENELTDHLTLFTANVDLQVLRGSRVVELRPAGVTKGAACRAFAGRVDADFIFAAGDDWTDEDMFRALPPFAVTIRVGIVSTNARFNLRDSRDVCGLLEAMAQARSGGGRPDQEWEPGAVDPWPARLADGKPPAM